MKARFLAPARAEFEEAKEYLEEARAGAGNQFSREVKLAISRIERFPNAWGVLSKNTRRCRIAKFQYGLIYSIVKDEIIILAVAHSRRKPNYWDNRKDEI